MSQRNESTILLLALFATMGLVGVGVWWFTERIKSNNSSNQVGLSNAGGCSQVQGIPNGRFIYGGSTTWAPIRRNVDSVIQNICPQFSLRYIDPPTKKPGSGIGIKMLIDNQLDFSQSSRSVKGKENQEAHQKGFSIKEIPVAIDGIAIALNPNLNISGLTIAQLKDIYTGKITNWNQVGGSNLKITAYSRRQEDSGTVEFFIENVLENENLGTNIEYVPTTTLAIRKVATNPGGIYYASAPEVVEQCTIKPISLGRKPDELVPPYQEPFVPPSECLSNKNKNKLNAAVFQSGDYPITRKLFVIVKLNGQIDQQAGEAYANWLLTDEGQELIEKTGFVRLR